MTAVRAEEDLRGVVSFLGNRYDVTISTTLASAAEGSFEAHLVDCFLLGDCCCRVVKHSRMEYGELEINWVTTQGSGWVGASGVCS